MSAAPVPAPRFHSDVLVGRAAELTALLDRIDGLDRADRADRTDGTAERAPNFTFVVGEPGIGKTRLVDEIAEHARRAGVPVLRGRAKSVGMSSMRPFSEALVGVARADWPLPDDLGPYLAVLGHLVPDLRPTDAAPTTPATPFVYGEAILRALAGPAPAHRPALLILEDLHDADPETIATLEYMLDNAAGARLTVVCSTRDLPCPALDLAEYARRRDPDALLTLHRLDASGTADLAAALLGTGSDALDGGLRTVLLRDGVGNPLVITEILRDLVAGGTLVWRDGAWRTTEPARLRVPRSLALSVADYLRRAQPTTRRLLQTAAVLGEEFPAHLVGAVARIDEAELWPALTAAVDENLLVPRMHEDWFAFRHPLLARAVADQLAASVHRELARAAAAAIEAGSPATQEWHLRAAELRETAGDTAGAARLYGAAGRAAAEGGSPTLAADLLRRALACVPADSREADWAELTASLVAVLGLMGRYDEALEYVPVVEAAEAAGLSGIAAADLHLRFARLAMRTGLPIAPHVSAIRKAIADAPAVAQRAELDTIAAIAAFVAVDSHASSQLAEVEELIRRAIDAARKAELPTLEVEALLGLAYHFGIQRQAEALGCLREAYQVARAHTMTAQQCEVLVLLGVVQWYWDLDAAGLRTAIREASATGAVMETRFAELSLALAEIAWGRFDEAQRIIDSAGEDVRRLGMPKVARYALAMQAIIHAHRGREQELAETVAAFDELRGSNEDEVPHVRGLALGMSALLRGDLPAARALFDQMRAVDGESQITKYYICGEYGLGLLVEAVDGAAGWERYRAVSAYKASEIPWNRQFLDCARAVLAGADGDAAEARRAIAQALETSKPFPLARHLALSLVAQSAARDGWGDPVRWVREAEAYFRDLGHEAAARCCRDRLRELGEPIRQWRQGSSEVPRALWTSGVTPREYEVLRLVARQRTNREIAAELHLSHRTVERHVANLLAKTGSANRQDLTGFVGAA